MQFLLNNLLLPVSDNPPVKRTLERILGKRVRFLQDYAVLRRSLDTRARNNPRYNYTLLLTGGPELAVVPNIVVYKMDTHPAEPQVRCTEPHPYVIGAGPAGMFAALAMVEQGFKPVVVEQGEAMENRVNTVDTLRRQGQLDPHSNVQYGEGGAGAFSDGKLTCRTRNYYINTVLDKMVELGAPDSISWEALPHLGTDGMRGLTVRLRKYLIAQGTTFLFKHRLESLNVTAGQVQSLRINGADHSTHTVVLAPGNAARPLFAQLAKTGAQLENKDFAAGVRIEHRQEFINHTFYGPKTDFSLTGPASYRLTHQAGKRGVFTFCMCPGGEVVAAASEEHGQVVNGMSWSKRDGVFANAALVAQITANDYGTSLFAGIDWQQQLEKAAFLPGYYAPGQTGTDFLRGTAGKLVESSYRPGVMAANLATMLPHYLTAALQEALVAWNKRFAGYADNCLLLGVETRTSCPIRIMRDDMGQCLGIKGVYPVGEGAGWAGGIVSSAADGYRTGSRFVYVNKKI